MFAELHAAVERAVDRGLTPTEIRLSRRSMIDCLLAAYRTDPDRRNQTIVDIDRWPHVFDFKAGKFEPIRMSSFVFEKRQARRVAVHLDIPFVLDQTVRHGTFELRVEREAPKPVERKPTWQEIFAMDQVPEDLVKGPPREAPKEGL